MVVPRKMQVVQMLVIHGVYEGKRKERETENAWGRPRAFTIRQLQSSKLRRNKADFHDSIMCPDAICASGEFTGAVTPAYLNARCKMNFQTISAGCI